MAEYSIVPETGKVYSWDPAQGPNWTEVPKNQIAVDHDTKQTYVLDGSAWKELPTPSSGSVVKDVATNAVSSVGKGAAGLLSLPRTIYDLITAPSPPNMGIDANGLTVPQPVQQQEAPPVPAGQTPITVADVMHQLPTAQDANRWLFKDIGLPYYTPSTDLGRVGSAAIQGGVEGAVGGIPGVVLGGAGGAAGQYAANEGAPPAGQVFASLLPSLVAGGLVGLGKLAGPALSNNVQRRIAADALDRAAGGPLTLEPAAVPGTPRTLFQATNNYGIGNLEKSAFSTPPLPNANAARGDINMPVAKAEMVTVANRRLLGELGGLGTVPAQGQHAAVAEAASGNMQRYIRQHENTLAQEETNAWNRIPGQNLTVPAGPLRRDLIDIIGGLTAARQEVLPGYVRRVVENAWARPQLTFDEIKNLRTDIANDMRDAIKGANPKTNLYAALRPIEARLRTAMDTVASTDPALQQDLENARFATRQYHQIFDEDTVNKIIDTTGAFDKVAAEKVASKFITFDGKSTTGYDKYLLATGNSPEAREAARDYVTANLMKSIQSTTPDADGNKLISATDLRKFIDTNRTLIDHPDLYTPAQRDILGRVADQADQLARTQRIGSFGTGGSDTYNKLAGEKFLNALVGPVGAQVLQLAAGTGGYMAASPFIGGVGGLAGGMGAYAFSRGLIKRAYAPAQRNVIGLINRALTDPEFAMDLQRFRSNPNARTLTKNLRTAFGISLSAAATAVKPDIPTYQSQQPMSGSSVFGGP